MVRENETASTITSATWGIRKGKISFIVQSAIKKISGMASENKPTSTTRTSHYLLE